MFKSPLKPKSIRKELTGKKVKIKSHAGPALRGRTGEVVDVMNCAKTVRVWLNPFTYVAKDNRVCVEPERTVVMNIKGLQLA
jgi:RNase P/RNase MRP subunit p29